MQGGTRREGIAKRKGGEGNKVRGGLVVFDLELRRLRLAASQDAG